MTSLLSNGLLSRSMLRAPSSGRPHRRGHELRTDWISDGLFEDQVYGFHRAAIDRPAEHIGDRRELLGATRTPECDGVSAVEDPTNREGEDRLIIAAVRELVQLRDGRQVLLQP